MMRPARILAGMALLLATAIPVVAQSAGPLEATVSVPEVEVRSGPSPKYYATGKLRQGDNVKIIKEEEGWLAITPPLGSFSWINARFIERHGQTAMVLGDKVPILVGSNVTNEKPTIKQVELPRGAQVVILGVAHEDEEGRWWPIQPHPSEVRYVPKNAVTGPKPPVEVSAQRPAIPTNANTAPGWANPAGGSEVGGGNAEAFWYQAEQAEKVGNYAEATRLYQECAKITSDHSLSIRCFNKIQALRDGNRGSVPPGYQPGVPREASTGDNRLVPTPASTTANRATSQYCYVKDAPPVVQARPTSYAPPANYPSQPVTPAPAAPTQMSGAGRLARAPFFVDGKQAYRLETNQGQVMLYATALPGLSLEPYVNRIVNLYGPIVYRGDVRTNYMTVSQVSPVQ